MTPTVDVTPQLTLAEQEHFNRAQAYEDAIAYRSARLAIPCPDCHPERCDDHATDVGLIATYQQAAAALALPPPGQ